MQIYSNLRSIRQPLTLACGAPAMKLKRYILVGLEYLFASHKEVLTISLALALQKCHYEAAEVHRDLHGQLHLNYFSL